MPFDSRLINSAHLRLKKQVVYDLQSGSQHALLCPHTLHFGRCCATMTSPVVSRTSTFGCALMGHTTAFWTLVSHHDLLTRFQTFHF